MKKIILLVSAHTEKAGEGESKIKKTVAEVVCEKKLKRKWLMAISN